MKEKIFDNISIIRRRKNAVTDEKWIRTCLRQSLYGIVATEKDGQPFAYGKLFVYLENLDPKVEEKQEVSANNQSNGFGTIYFHGAQTGRTYTNIHENPNVCFTVSRMGNIILSTSACSFDVEYSSVVVFGKALVIVDQTEVEIALKEIMEKYAPTLTYHPMTLAELERTCVYKIVIQAWSGKTNPPL